MQAELQEKLKTLPRGPGVYFFRDREGEVLYVGKAKTLRTRVRNYFQRGDTRAGMVQLVGKIADVEVIVTRTEAEALHLEQNLVKRYRPPFNVRLRDDKSFPYIAVTLTDEYPRVMFTRERHRRGTVYFGPYANAKKVRETLDVLNRVFKFRPCEGPKPGRHSGIPCLDFHIDRCFAPCVGEISKEDYAQVIEGVVGFLSGDTKPIQRELEARMREAAADERFEEAARYRNRLNSIRHLAERQATEQRAVGTVDVIGLAIDGDCAAVQIFPLRDGRMIDRYGFHLENVVENDELAVLEAFVVEYYGSAPSVPPQVLVPVGIKETEAIAEFLSERRGSRVEVRAPARGEKRRLVELAIENAKPRARGGHRQPGGAAASAYRGARGAARVPQPREPAAADRVLRHLEHPGRVDRRLDDRLRGRAAAELALPDVRDPRARRAGRRRRDARGHLAAVPAPALGGGGRELLVHAEPRRRGRRQGPARSRAGGDGGAGPPTRRRDRAREARGGGVRAGGGGADPPRSARARAPAAAADPGRGAPGRAPLPPQAPRVEVDGDDLRRVS